MRLKIRCDGKCEKFCKIFWELNKALVVRYPERIKVIVSMHLLGESLLSAAWLQQKAMARKMHNRQMFFLASRR